MKLIRIKIDIPEDKSFRSLQNGFEFKLIPDLTSNLTPLCFVGLNGSGKSNIMELLSEIFFYLDLYHLRFKEDAKPPSYGFEIEYAMPFTADNTFFTFGELGDLTFNEATYFIIKINKRIQEKPEFYVKHPKGEYKRVTDNTASLLPKKIIAYTSGMNELLSNAFYKMQYHYFNEYEYMLKEQIEYKADSSRLFFLDNKSNAAVFIANFLLSNPKTLKEITDIIELEDISSFRITLRDTNYNGDVKERTAQQQDKIKRLKKCATSYYTKKQGKTTIETIDFFVTPAIKEAFKNQFSDSAFELYKTFYELDLLNIHSIPVRTRDLVLNAPKWLNISDEIPQANPNDLLFRIENVMLKKRKVNDPIKYKNLSDGEHQFMQVLGSLMMIDENGCLFLLDEPETHYNPVWRSKLISKILNVTKIYNLKVPQNRLQEIILTTHSPFLLSDTKKENVVYFEKKNGIVNYSHPKEETYGKSSSYIMDEVFGKEDTISEIVMTKFKEFRKQADENPDQILEIKNALLEFGDSIEKFDLISFLNRKRKEQEN